MTHVRFVSYDDVPALGGQGLMLDELRSGLRARGLRVSTLAGRGEHAVRYPRRLGRGPLDFSAYLQRDPELLVQHEPDLVHVFGGPGGVLFARSIPVPLVYHAHHTYAQAHPRFSVKRALSVLEARGYRRADRVLAVSRSTAAAVEAMGVDPARIEVVPPAVEVMDQVVAPREPARVLYVGRLEPEKGVLDALAVMRSLARERPEVRGVVIGAGSLGAVVLEHAARDGNIDFLGSVDTATLRREYARASVLLMPSRYEGLGRTALEAQSAGTPVVGYDVSGLRDAVAEGGILVAPRDVAALRVACAALLDHPRRRAEIGERGRDFVQANHAPEVVMSRLLRVYDQVLDEGGH
jgi:glycogen(starch) synthase